MDLQEWGNPVANKSTYDLLLSYSPMDNVKQQAYPSMLAVGGKDPHDALLSSRLQNAHLSFNKLSACPGQALPGRSDELSEMHPDCRAA